MLPRNVLKDFAAFWRSLHRGPEALVCGVEHHPSGRQILHLHALLSGPYSASEREMLKAEWGRHRGFAKATEIHDRMGCVEYAAKHLLKQHNEDCLDFHILPKNGSRHERRRSGGLLR